MKKVVLLTFALVGLIISSYAQNAKSFYRSSYESRNSGSFKQSFSLFTLGYGLYNQALPGLPGSSYSKFALGPVYAKYEHGFLRDEIGLGGQIALTNGWEKVTISGTTYRNSMVAFSASFSGFYHFNKLIPVNDLDVYVGTGLSIWNRIYNYESSYPAGTRTDYSTTNAYLIWSVGARYYVKPKLGLYAEACGDYMSAFNFGVTFKL